MNVQNKLKEIVSLKSYVGKSGNGKEIFEEEYDIKAMVNEDLVTTKTLSGEILTCKGSIITVTPIKDFDLITFEERKYKLKEVKKIKKKGKIVYYKGYLL